MKKFLASTAILAAMGAPAFAAGTSEPSQSLLSGLLTNASALSASLSNVAENLNDVNGSVAVDTSRNFTGLASDISAIGAGSQHGFGSYSQAGTNVFAQDLPTSLLNVLNPLTLSMGDISTTAIGAMQSGSITATVDTSKIVDKVTTSSGGASTNAAAAAEAYGGTSGALSFQNIAVNSGAIDGSVALTLADVNSTIGKVGTTAIGAMGSGSLTATMTGNMGGVTSNTAAIVTALVGGPIFP